MSINNEISIESSKNKKTLESYLIGFVLSIILTFAAFSIVENHVFTNAYLYISLAVLAITQLFVQVTCFIRLNNSAEGKWNLLPFLFVVLIITILVGGSLWIMYNLNFNMIN